MLSSAPVLPRVPTEMDPAGSPTSASSAIVLVLQSVRGKSRDSVSFLHGKSLCFQFGHSQTNSFGLIERDILHLSLSTVLFVNWENDR